MKPSDVPVEALFNALRTYVAPHGGMGQAVDLLLERLFSTTEVVK